MDSEQIKLQCQAFQEFLNHRDIVDFHSLTRIALNGGTNPQPFFFAIYRNMPWIVEMFLSNVDLLGLDLYAEDPFIGLTPLRYAKQLKLKRIEKIIKRKIDEMSSN